MSRKYWSSVIYTMGLTLILFIVVSLAFSNAKVIHLYQMVGVVIPVHLFSFFTFELKLFSKRIWIRRTIAIAFSIFVLCVSGCITGRLRLELKSLIIYCVTALICIIASVFSYYVEDKIEQQNLKLINQKLGEKNAGDDNIDQ